MNLLDQFKEKCEEVKLRQFRQHMPRSHTPKGMYNSGLDKAVELLSELLKQLE